MWFYLCFKYTFSGVYWSSGVRDILTYILSTLLSLYETALVCQRFPVVGIFFTGLLRMLIALGKFSFTFVVIFVIIRTNFVTYDSSENFLFLKGFYQHFWMMFNIHDEPGSLKKFYIIIFAIVVSVLLLNYMIAAMLNEY